MILDKKGNPYQIRHFLVVTNENTYQGVEFEDLQVVVNVQGRLASYSSKHEMKGDFARILAPKLVSAWIYWEGAASEEIVRASVTPA